MLVIVIALLIVVVMVVLVFSSSVNSSCATFASGYVMLPMISDQSTVM